jgi:hypothetical protein
MCHPLPIRGDLIVTAKSCLALVAAATVSGIVLGGCAASTQSSASSPAASSSTASTKASPAAGTTSASAVAQSSSASTAAPAAGPAECSAAQLKITYTDNSQINNGALDGMSHHDSVIMLTNIASVSCTTRGYLGIALLNSAGKQVKQAVRAGGTGTESTVVLKPGGTASAEMQANSASCSSYPTVAGLLVTAPDQKVSTRLGPPSQPLCRNSVTISWLVPGNAGGTGV